MFESMIESFDGTPIRVSDTGGNRPPVILVHGITMTYNTTFNTRFGTLDDGRVGPVRGDTIASRLNDLGARVIGGDLRGHGRSGRSDQPDRYRGDSYALDVVAVIDALHLDAVDIVGYSMGAMTVCRLLGLDPRIRSAVVAGIGPDHIEGGDSNMFKGLADIGRCFMSGDFSENPSAKAFRAYARLDPSHDFGSLGAALLAMEPVLLERLASATVPVLVMNGGDDYPEDVEPLAAMIPTAESRVAGTGNHGMACSDDDFQLALVDFVTLQWSR